MKQTDPSVDVRFLKLDLQDFQSIRAALVEFKEKETRLDLLINNAGVCDPNWLPGSDSDLRLDHGIPI